jgi:hypothetical protein
MAHGVISAGIDLGIISTGIDLATPESVIEYSALQATIIGIRGMIGPFLGVALLALGMSDRAIFAIGCCFIFGGWLCLGLVTSGRRERKPAAEQPRQV